MSPAAAAMRAPLIAIGSIITGIVFAFGSIWDPAGLMDWFYKIISSGGEGVAGVVTPEARVSVAIAGGMFAGFASLFLTIVAPAVARNDRAIIRGAMFGLGVWFAVDSTASYLTGNAANVVANSGLVTLFLLPLILVKAVPAAQS